MKKLINSIPDVVQEQLAGIALAHPELNVQIDPHFITRGDAPISGKVAIVSGGGSGHEPMHGGYVGMGMLDGACPGEVFTSPTPDQMYECCKVVDSGAGVLLIVTNYTGDVLSFEAAIEMLHFEGMQVRNVIVDDDVAVKDSLFTAGRRGVGTTVITEKIVGAAAEAGYDLNQCTDLARKVILNGRSMGMALTSCTVPERGEPTFSLGDDEMEIGIGIHGEPGQKRMTVQSADEITTILTNEILNDAGYTRTVREWDGAAGDWAEKELVDDSLAAGDEVIALVNSMGGTPVSELYTVYGKMAQLCEAQGIKIARHLIGSYITSLEMQGCSITLVKADDEILKFWDSPVNTPALRWGV